MATPQQANAARKAPVNPRTGGYAAGSVGGDVAARHAQMGGRNWGRSSRPMRKGRR